MSRSPSPTSSEETVTPGPRRFSRLPEAGFGDRLADARNLPPVEAPPPPPPRAPAENFNSGIWNSLISQEDSAVASPSPAVTPVIHGVPQYGPKYGGEKGSYRSPYDYNIPGRTMGGKNVFSDQSTLHGLGAPGLHPKSISFGEMTPIDTSSPPKNEAPATKPKIAVVHPPAGTPERILLLGPLRLMRRQCELRESIRPFGDWLDTHMGDELHTVYKKDAIIPSIVYAISIPMNDEHWAKYNLALMKFLLPKRFHEMLAAGEDHFNFFSGSTNPFVSPALQLAHSQLLYVAQTEMDIEDFHAEMVKYHKWMWMTQGAGYEGGPGNTQW